MSPALRDKLCSCWNRGMGLTETADAVRRSFGVTPDAEVIHRHFVTFSDEFFGQVGNAA